MILPTIRASFSRHDAIHLVNLLGRHDPELRDAARDRLETDGADALLDDPRVLNAILTDPEVKAPPALVFYVLIRQSLLESGVTDRGLADYVASVVLAFGQGSRAYRVSEDADEEFRYLVDMMVKASGSSQREAFLVRTHLGNYSLWLAGLFPDYLEARTRRKGAPPMAYYERVGSTGYRQAAESKEAQQLGVEKILAEVGRRFGEARTALNKVADRYLWPEAGDPVGRLLREVVGRSG